MTDLYLRLINHKLEKLMTQIDDIKQAFATLQTDTKQFIADVSAKIAALQASLAVPDISQAISDVNALDAVVKAADAALPPTP